MRTLGLIGGIGSGKSTVALLFIQLGAGVIHVDVIGHQVLCLSEVGAAIRERWGNGVFDENGEPDRKAIADIVFAPTEPGRRELAFLTELTHPIIRREIDSELRKQELASKPAVVLDAALLLETNWKTSVDFIAFVDVPRSVRLERVLQRGWTEAQFDAREAAQLPLDVKKAQADAVIDNSGSIAQTFDAVKHVWKNLIGGSRPTR